MSHKRHVSPLYLLQWFNVLYSFNWFTCLLVHFIPLNVLSVCISLRTARLACLVTSHMTGSRKLQLNRREQHDKQTGWQSPNWIEELQLSELTFPDTIYKIWITLSVDCVYIYIYIYIYIRVDTHIRLNTLGFLDCFRVWTNELYSFNRLSLPGFIVLF